MSAVVTEFAIPLLYETLRERGSKLVPQGGIQNSKFKMNTG
ncbi:MAG: hypothetical protein V7K38_11195 [Nostoc sp.]